MRTSLFPFMSMMHHFPSIMVPMIGFSLYHMIRVLPSKRRRVGFAYSLPNLNISENIHKLEECLICIIVDGVMDSIGCLSVPRFRCHDKYPTACGRSFEDCCEVPESYHRYAGEERGSWHLPCSVPVLPLSWR